MPGSVIVENERLIHSIANKFYGIEKEDLMQAGFLGLTKAYRKYNPEFGVKFSTYAYGFIYGEMYEAATCNRPLKVKKPEMKLYKGVIKTKELLENKFGRTLSYSEVCTYLNVDYSLFLSILNSLSANVSLDDKELDIPYRESVDDLIMLRESLDSLTALEKSIITERYMKDRSQDEVAKSLGLSQVKVSRIEKKSKEKMKKFVSS